MASLRVQRRPRAFAISVRTIEDERLSWGALGLFAVLIAASEGGNGVEMSSLRRRPGLGKERLEALIEELVVAGYLERHTDPESPEGVSYSLYEESTNA